MTLMIPQTVLPFKLVTTDDTLAAHAWLVLFAEYYAATDSYS